MLTWPTWSFRPIIAAKITPLLYLTDDTRDFAAGGELGFAFKIGGFGDLGLLLAKHNASSLDIWDLELSVYPR